MTASEQIAAITPRVAELQAKCDKYWQHLVAALSEKGYQKVDFSKLDKQQEHFWKAYFQREIFPILSPQIVDQRHPFPFLRNKEIYFGVQLYTKADGIHYGIIPISNQFERVLFTKDGNVTRYAFVEELIAHYASSIFRKNSVQKSCLFRVTRNADITVDEGMMDHDIDFRDVMSELLKKRRKLAAVRLQFWPEAPQEIVKFLREKLVVPADRCFVQTSPLDSGCLFRLSSRISSDGNAALFYPPARPIQAPNGYDLYREAHEHDVLIAYPLSEHPSLYPYAAQGGGGPQRCVHQDDPLPHGQRLPDRAGADCGGGKRQRSGGDGGAARPLRRTEQHRLVQTAGGRRLHGLRSARLYKVHSKLTLITSKVDGKYHYLTQIGTGNYNEKTSEQYTDLSFITSRRRSARRPAPSSTTWRCSA